MLPRLAFGINPNEVHRIYCSIFISVCLSVRHLWGIMYMNLGWGNCLI